MNAAYFSTRRALKFPAPTINFPDIQNIFPVPSHREIVG